MKKSIISLALFAIVLAAISCNNGGQEENPDCRGCPAQSRSYGYAPGDTGTVMIELTPIGRGEPYYIPVHYTVDTSARPLDTLHATFDE